MIISVTELTRKVVNNKALADIYYFVKEEARDAVKVEFKANNEILNKYFRTNLNNLEIFHFPEAKFSEEYSKIYLEMVKNNLISKFTETNENYETATSYMKNKVREYYINRDFENCFIDNNIYGIKLSMKEYNWNEDYYSSLDYEDAVEYAENKFRENSTSLINYTTHDAYVTFSINTRQFPLTEKELMLAEAMYIEMLQDRKITLLGTENTYPVILDVYSKSKDLNIAASEADLVLALYKKLCKAYEIYVEENFEDLEKQKAHNWMKNYTDNLIDMDWHRKYASILDKIGININSEKVIQDFFIGINILDAIVIYQEYTDMMHTERYADTDYGEDEESEENEYE